MAFVQEGRRWGLGVPEHTGGVSEQGRPEDVSTTSTRSEVMDVLVSAPPKRRWRVFYTAPRAEKKCEERLEEAGLDVFLPKYTEVRTWKNGKNKVVEPLFRNYIFARVDERERVQVLETDGIVRCVRFEGKPAEISQGEIDQIRILLQDPARLSVVGQPVPVVGEKVVVVTGPLQGLRGEVVRQGAQAYVIVRIDAIHQVVKVNVPADWIRKA